jgi:malate dehydrogenase (quinone)
MPRPPKQEGRCDAGGRRHHEFHLAWLNELEPGWSMEMVERLDKVAEESSNGWNNAGTGHSALAELNYTPEKDGKIDISKAVEINESFQITRQFLAWQVKQGC